MITEAQESRNLYLESNRRHAIYKLDQYLARPEEQVLREYQMDALEALRNFLSEGETAGYINLPTGSGKSVIIAELAEAVDLKTLVLSPTIPILKQTGKKFSSDVSLTQRGGGSKDLTGQVVNATYQSIEADIKAGRINPSDFDLVIADEAHTALGRQRHKIFKHFPQALMIGLTATPYFDQIESYRKRKVIEENERWTGMFENSIHEMSLEEGIERGILANLDVSIVRTGVRVGEMTNVKGDYNEKELDKFLNVWVRNSIALGILTGVENIPEGAVISDETKAEIERLHEKIKGKKTAVFGISIDHIQDLSRQLSLTGARVKTVYAEGMTQDERDRAFKAYEEGEIDILLGVDLIRMGWDSPDTEVGIYLAPTKSGVVATQELGRILRKTPSKDTAIAIQLADIFEGRGQAPILIPNIFDPYFVMRGSIAGERGLEKQSSQKIVLPKIRFSGIGIEAIIEEAKSQELLRQKFNKADITELDHLLTDIASRIYAKNPEISPIEFYQAFADELPFRIGSDVIDKARQAIASIDSNTVNTGKRVLQYLWMRQALAAAKPYLTGDSDYDSDILHEGFLTFYEDVAKINIATSVRPVGNLVEKGVIRFIAEREGVPIGWIKKKTFPQIRDLVDDFINNRDYRDFNNGIPLKSVSEIAELISEEVGESVGSIENYIQVKIAERFGQVKSTSSKLTSNSEGELIAIEEVRYALDTISTREREIISLYYGIDRESGMTLEEVAAILRIPVTRERVRQILNKGLRKLRHPSRSKMLIGFMHTDEIDLPISMPVIEQRRPSPESLVRKLTRARGEQKDFSKIDLKDRRWDTVVASGWGKRAISLVGVVDNDLDTMKKREALFKEIASLIEGTRLAKIVIEKFDDRFRLHLAEYLRKKWGGDISYIIESVFIFVEREEMQQKVRDSLSPQNFRGYETAIVARLPNLSASLDDSERKRIMGF